jgi:hypothetical protein
LKWRAVMQQTEAAKKAGSKEINYSVAPGRSGQSNPFPFVSTKLYRTWLT